MPAAMTVAPRETMKIRAPVRKVVRSIGSLLNLYRTANPARSSGGSLSILPDSARKVAKKPIMGKAFPCPRPGSGCYTPAMGIVLLLSLFLQEPDLIGHKKAVPYRLALAVYREALVQAVDNPKQAILTIEQLFTNPNIVT